MKSVEPLRVLSFAIRLPFPPSGGVDLRNWQNIQALLTQGELGVFGLWGQDFHPPLPGSLTFWRSSQDPPLQDVTGKDIRKWDWLSSPAAHPAGGYFSAHVIAELEDILNEFTPDVILLETLWLYPYIDYFKSRGCSVILDAHNVEAPLAREMASSTWGSNPVVRLIRTRLADRVAMVEAETLRKVDQVWVCSAHEAALLHDLYRPAASVHIIPNTVDVSAYATARAAAQPAQIGSSPTAPTVIFPAVFGYPPNETAALFLIQEVFPRLSLAVSHCQLLLPGRHPTVAMVAAARQDARILVTGAVPDMRPYLAQATAMAVPLIAGGGTRYKILEAFAAGVPVVSTAKGVEGLEVVPGRHYLPAESPEEFVDAILGLWSDPRSREELRQQAHALVREHYSWDAAYHQIRAALCALPGIP